ncbi:MAG TPA: putative toxin-antitoxin system toxin component, PIN family [Candidatus Nanoarchaeia archaeon]|nr:putative toxin-antitoxin system toxin component, PIN family [Candidatus Nanoarchaeia archaeon]
MNCTYSCNLIRAIHYIFNFYTDQILDELRDVLARPKFDLEKEKRDHFVLIIQETSFEVEQIKEFLVDQCRDSKDDKFLSLAKQIDADYLISFDDDLLVIRQIGRTIILTPGDFLGLMRESDP